MFNFLDLGLSVGELRKIDNSAPTRSDRGGVMFADAERAFLLVDGREAELLVFRRWEEFHRETRLKRNWRERSTS
jgi:hypothetical protein